MKRVICIEGVHGSGKTTLCSYLKQRSLGDYNVKILDESFMQQSLPNHSPTLFVNNSNNMNVYTSFIHPQSLVNESYWTCCWFQRVLKAIFSQHQYDHCNSGDMSTTTTTTYTGDNKNTCLKIIVDRSPYSALFYTRRDRGKYLSDMIKQSIQELYEDCQIEFTLVYLRVPDRTLLWNRIASRLDHSRRQLNEANRDHLNKIYDLYDNVHSDLWDITVDTSEFNYDNEQIYQHLLKRNIL